MRCGASGGEHGAGQRVVVGRAGDRRRAGPAGAGRAGRRCGPLRLGGILLRRASQPAHADGRIMRAVRRFLAWCEGQGVELAGDHAGHGRPVPRRPGRVARQAEPAPGGVTRLLRPAGQPACLSSSTRRRRCKGVKDQVIEGKTPEITVEQARTLLASVGYRPSSSACGTGRSSPRWPIPPAGPGRWPSCGWAISSTTGSNTCCGSRRRAARAGKSRCGTTWRALYWPMSRRRASRARPRIRRCSGRATAGAGS